MYDQSKLSELIRFARVDAGSTVIDVYPGDGDWTRLFSDIVGPEGRVYSFVPAEVAHFKNDPVGRMRTLAKEPGRENVEAVSADLVAMPEATQPADVLWLHLFYHDLHTALIQARGATAARLQSSRLRAAEARWVLRHRRPRRRRRGGHERRPVAASDRACIRPRGGGGGRLRAGRGKHHAREQGRSALDQGVRSLDQGRDRSLRLSVREALTGPGAHEQVSFERRPGRYVVREFFAHRFDPETRHLLLQYAAAMIDRIVSMAGDAKPGIARIEIRRIRSTASGTFAVGSVTASQKRSRAGSRFSLMTTSWSAPSARWRETVSNPESSTGGLRCAVRPSPIL